VEQSIGTADRTDEDWLTDLAADGAQREGALSDLRAYLQRGLYASLRASRSDLASRDADDVRQITEDFTQESLLKILDKLSTYRGESRFTSWAMKVAVRTAISQLRKAAYRDLSLDDLEARGAPLRLPPQASVHSQQAPDPQREAERREVLAVLNDAIETELSDRQRTTLRATAFDGVPIEVMADLMGSNRNALYKMMHDARRRLRDRLITRGYTSEGVASLFGGD